MQINRSCNSFIQDIIYIENLTQYNLENVFYFCTIEVKCNVDFLPCIFRFTEGRFWSFMFFLINKFIRYPFFFFLQPFFSGEISYSQGFFFYFFRSSRKSDWLFKWRKIRLFLSAFPYNLLQTIQKLPHLRMHICSSINLPYLGKLFITLIQPYFLLFMSRIIKEVQLKSVYNICYLFDLNKLLGRQMQSGAEGGI